MPSPQVKHIGKSKQARPEMGGPLLPLPIYLCSTYPPRQHSYRISSYGTTWFLADYKRYPGNGAQCQVGLSPECLFNLMYMSRTFIPNTHRKLTTVMERRPSENLSAYLPTSSEDHTTSFTWGVSLKIAPLKRSWCLVCS